MNRWLVFARACLALTPLLGSLPASAAPPPSVPALLHFQGRLAKPDGTPVTDGQADIVFSLYDAPTGGTLLWQRSVTKIAVKNGVFATLLNFTKGFENGATFASAFNGSPIYLSLRINDNDPLMPRQQLVSNAYAFTANTASLALAVGDGSVTNAALAPGAITADKFAGNLFNPIAWLLGGNSGTNGMQFLGTTDTQPLVFKVNGRQAMRYSYAENTLTGFRTINILGGSEVNSIGAGVVGATIAGGGTDAFTGTSYPNTVTVDFGTVGGGLRNTASGVEATVAGGYANTASGAEAAVGGGGSNTACGIEATVAGGTNNLAGGDYAAIGGGFFNRASGKRATVEGGGSNSANGSFATVGGGYANTAAGSYSFAGGQQAQAIHDGAFVWNDASNLNLNTFFTSTGVNQFLIHASGGVGINTNNPGVYALNVTGSINASGQVRANGVVLTSDARYKTNVATFPNALETVLGLRGVTFDWNRDRWQEKAFPSGRQVGFIAQEVESVLPELVTTDAQGYKAVAYQNVVPVLVEALKQQQKQIAALQSDNAALKRQNARISDLEAKLNALLSAHK